MCLENVALIVGVVFLIIGFILIFLAKKMFYRSFWIFLLIWLADMFFLTSGFFAMSIKIMPGYMSDAKHIGVAINVSFFLSLLLSSGISFVYPLLKSRKEENKSSGEQTNSKNEGS